MNYAIVLSRRAERDLDRMDRPTRQRVLRRLEQLAADPFDARISAPLAGEGELRKSRVGGWRIIFQVDKEARIVLVAMIERRGQVYQRI